MQEIPFLGPKKAKRLKNIEDKCRENLKRQRLVSEVFVTFDKEKHQRNALQVLEVGELNIQSENRSALSSQYLFRGNRMLEVFEANEPSAIRWADLLEPEYVSAFFFRNTCFAAVG